jgi:hypothetical protein
MKEKAENDKRKADDARKGARALRCTLKWYHFVPIGGAIAQIVNEVNASNLYDDASKAQREAQASSVSADLASKSLLVI